MKDLIDFATASSCACANLRKTDIVVTQFYDGILAPSGLYAIQFGMLTVLARFAPITVNQLAAILDSDRITVNRHLKVLVDEGLICYEEPKVRDAHRIRLTEEGVQTLKRAWPLWQEAQARIEGTFGQERFRAFLEELRAVRSVLSLNAVRV